MEPILNDELLRDRSRQFEEFFSGFEHHDYSQDIVDMLNDDKTRLLVNIDDVRQYNRAYADE
jgi:DNA replication licensing factor MCM3